MAVDQPQQLGPYRVDRVVGEGGFGVVYAASRPEVPGAVAIKVLREDLEFSDTEVTRFLREAETLASVTHPHIVRVVDYGRLPDGRPYLAMPLLEGAPLSDVLERGALPQEAAVDLFLQLAAAVEALHQVDLVHRDIKPDNVMLVEDGKRALLLDLGIAKRLSEGPSTTTRAGLVRGTPAYMAPERFYGKPASTRSDAYELALVLYAMLAGGAPWDDPTDPMARHRPRPLSAAGVPPALSDVVMRALRADPKLRPPSMAALAEGVEAAAAAGDVSGATGALTFTPVSGESFRPPGPSSDIPPSIGVEPTELAQATPEVAIERERGTAQSSRPPANGESDAREAAPPTPDRTPPPSTALPRSRASERRWFLAAAGGALLATAPWLAERFTRLDQPAPAGTMEVSVPPPSSTTEDAPPPEASSRPSAVIPRLPEEIPAPPSPKGAHPPPPLDAPARPFSAPPPGVQPALPYRDLPAPSCDAWVAWACSPPVVAHASSQCPTIRGVVKQYRETYGILPGNRLEPACAKQFVSDRARVTRGMKRIEAIEAERAREKAEKERRRAEREAKRARR